MSNLERQKMEHALSSVSRMSISDQTCLKFNYWDHVPEDQQHGVFIAKFVRFVSDILRDRGNTPVDKFELIYGRENKHPHPAMKWVDHIAVNFKPRVIILDICVKDYNFTIPNSVFSCTSLEEIELTLHSECPDNGLPAQVYLPSLKKLTLCGLMLFKGFFEKLFSGSCLLEKVVLDSCMLATTLVISSSSLKHFALRDSDYCADVQIDAPSLIYLNIRGNHNGSIFVKNLVSLVDAQVQIYGWDLKSSNFTGHLQHISAFYNATTLDLAITSDVMKENMEQICQFPTFINLKTLVIGKWCMVNEFALVAAFLRHSPNLQMLKLFHASSGGSNLGGISSGASFLKEYLQTVVIDTRSVNGALDSDSLYTEVISQR